MTPDRHLGSAWIEKLRPDLLITETTYATTIRDSKKARERDFLKRVHQCVERGGKVIFEKKNQHTYYLIDSFVIFEWVRLVILNRFIWLFLNRLV